MENPFVVKPYKSSELFCDRVSETAHVSSLLLSGDNVTLISPRRYGKTGLIYRVFDEIKSKHRKIVTCYVDIYSANNLEDFVKLFSEAVVASVQENSLVKKFFSAMGGVRPLLSFDSITGSPQVSIAYQNENQKVATLKSIFDFLETQKNKVIVAIDEFQQIRAFPNVKTEALLRTYIQPLKNVSFVFCGSKKHVMVDMFLGEKSPFYESTTPVYLDKIDPAPYADFIKRMFTKGGRKIDDESVEFILEWTKRHTYYTQYLCRRIFLNGNKKINLAEVKIACSQILYENVNGFLERRNLITDSQWLVLKAVARDGVVTQPTSGDFLMRHRLGNAASVKRIFESLVDKELLLEEVSEKGRSYSVYNVFLSRWLES